MGPFIYIMCQSRKNGSVIYSFLRKRGLIVYMYLAGLKKGAIRAAHPYYVIYRKLPPQPRRHVTKKNLLELKITLGDTK